MSKHAFIVYSGETDLGKVFHAMTHAKQANSRGDQVDLYFAAEGTAWPDILGQKDHAMNPLFEEVKSQGLIKGACENCAVAFDNKDSASQHVELVKGPECSYGQIDILGLEDEGYRVWVF